MKIPGRFGHSQQSLSYHIFFTGKARRSRERLRRGGYTGHIIELEQQKVHNARSPPAPFWNGSSPKRPRGATPSKDGTPTLTHSGGPWHGPMVPPPPGQSGTCALGCTPAGRSKCHSAAFHPLCLGRRQGPVCFHDLKTRATATHTSRVGLPSSDRAGAPAF